MQERLKKWGGLERGQARVTEEVNIVKVYYMCMWKYNKPFALCDYYVLIKIGAGEKVTKPKDN
jgi:hypothetical protein